MSKRLRWRTWKTSNVEHLFVGDSTRPACGQNRPKDGWRDGWGDKRCGRCMSTHEIETSEPVTIREQIVEEIKVLLDNYPMLRLGQILVNALGEDPFYVLDNDALGKLRAWRKEMERDYANKEVL